MGSKSARCRGFFPERIGGRDWLWAVPILCECQRCSACCRWPGQARLTDAEITRLAQWQGMNEFDFIQKFTRLAHDRSGLALQEKPGDECVFLQGNDCSVQPVKPQQCRDFPNLWNFPGFDKVCRATSHLLGDEEYNRRLGASLGTYARARGNGPT